MLTDGYLDAGYKPISKPQPTKMQRLGGAVCCEYEPFHAPLPARKGGVFHKMAMSKPGNTHGTPGSLVGTWQLDDIHGDMEMYLLGIGYSQNKRQLSRTKNYGIGQQKLELRQDANLFEMVARNGPVTYTQRMEIDAGQKETLGNRGKILVSASLEGGSLRCDVSGLDGKELYTRWFYREGSILVSELLTVSNSTRVFQKFSRV
jgi:hypothetical protein